MKNIVLLATAACLQVALAEVVCYNSFTEKVLTTEEKAARDKAGNSSLLALSNANSKQLRNGPRYFPEGFRFGTSTASYQVEGAWNEDGKSENIWDRLSHTTPCAIAECHTGDIASDSYHNVERDVEMLRELGLDFYRFSLSWSRLMPTSFPDQINPAGVAYYNKLIDEMLKYNIQPMVTLYHWDLPQKLQDLGGWSNPHVVDWYSDYARVAFELFGDRVKTWSTFNEPKEICWRGYATAAAAPLYNISGFGDYLCAKNLLLSHAKVYHMYDNEFRPTQNGVIGITLSMQWYESESEEHEEATEDYMQFEWGIYANPIFSKEGNFPKVMRERVAAKSAEQGFYRSRLPEFTEEEVDLIRGSADFFGINHYTSGTIYRNASTIGMFPIPSTQDDCGAVSYIPDDWEREDSQALAVHPSGFYNLLTRIRKAYNNPVVYITENGYPTRGGLEDDNRIYYIRRYLDALLDAVDEGSNVQVYGVWSLMDNFEWLSGYTINFGLYEVDFESPARTRTPRRSAFVYKDIIRIRGIDYHYVPDTTVMTIDKGH